MPRLVDYAPSWAKSWASLGRVDPSPSHDGGHLAYLHDPAGNIGLTNCKYSNFNWRRIYGEDLRAATGTLAAFLVVAGETRFGTSHDTRLCRPGEGILLDFDQDFRFGNESLTTTETCVIFLPRGRLLLPSAALLRGLPLSPGTLSGGLLAAAVAHLADRFGSIEPGELSNLAPALTALVAAAANDALDPAVKWGRELRMSRIIKFIDANLASRQLEPDVIAGHFAMSRATLYRMFEPLGGVAGFIRERRLARAMADLTAPGSPSRSIAAAGRKAGYPGAASFSRAFRSHFGMSPAEAARLRKPGEKPDPLPARTKTLAGYLRDLGAR